METETQPETPTPQPKPGGSVLYDIDERGAITRHDTKIANSKPVGIAGLKDGKVRWAHPDFVRYIGQVKALLKHRGIEAEFVPYEARPPVTRDATLVAVEGGEAPRMPEPPPPPTDDPDGPDGMRGLTVEQRKAINYLRSKEGFELGAVERPAPPEPRKTSGAGDKTPSYVRWLLRYHPKQFCQRYGVQGMGEIEVVVPGQKDPVTGLKRPATRRWEGGHVLAKRKTIFTDILTNRRDAAKEDNDQ